MGGGLQVLEALAVGRQGRHPVGELAPQHRVDLLGGQRCERLLEVATPGGRFTEQRAIPQETRQIQGESVLGQERAEEGRQTLDVQVPPVEDLDRALGGLRIEPGAEDDQGGGEGLAVLGSDRAGPPREEDQQRDDGQHPPPPRAVPTQSRLRCPFRRASVRPTLPATPSRWRRGPRAGVRYSTV